MSAHKAIAPKVSTLGIAATVTASAQYGLRLQATGVLFNNAYNIPRNKV